MSGSGFAAGAQVVFGSTILTPSGITATSIVVAIGNGLIQTAGTVSVTVRLNGASSNTFTFTVTPGGASGLQITSLSPTSRPLNSGNFSLTITGLGFASGAQVVFGSTALTPGVIFTTSLVVTIPNNLIQSPGTVPVSVRVNNANSNTVLFTVTTSLPGGVVPAISLASLDTVATNVIITLASPAPYAITGTITMDFTNSVGLAANYRDPAMGFASGGLSTSFTIAQGQTHAVFPNGGAVNFGTVAGSTNLNISALSGNGQNLLPSLAGQPTFVVVVRSTPPVITANSVQIVNVPGGFNVLLRGYSTTRNVQSASFQFTLAANATPDTATVFTVGVASVFGSWFNSSAGLSNGSRFLLTVPFTTTVDANLVRSVTVTLVNSLGSSAPVSGGR